VRLRRVVITGIGVVSPIGLTRDAFWNACQEGRSGAVRLDSPWVTGTDLSTRIAAPVRGFEPRAEVIPPKQLAVLDRTSQFALAAAHEALVDAGFGLVEASEKRGRLLLDGIDPSRVATIIGSGIGGLSTLEASHALWREKRSKTPVKRYSLPMLIPNSPAGQVAIRFGAEGECKSISTACAAGTMSIGDGWRLVRGGEADVVLAGGAEGVAGDEDAYALMGFERLHTLSTRNDDPQGASRPFDLHRDGFVLADGAAVLVLESEASARARGARVYAELAGYATNCDAHSMMQLDDSGRSILELIRAALRAADIDASAVQHVSAHGTSTIANDRTESKALRLAFGARAGEITVTALKSMTGHAIGGSGPMEAAALAMSIRDGLLIPTINYETPDPECEVNLVANQCRAADTEVALKLSYGFGGHNACLVLARA
jgi:3-oxoacyl-[acyl-carrier-protein] synthase II